VRGVWNCGSKQMGRALITRTPEGGIGRPGSKCRVSRGTRALRIEAGGSVGPGEIRSNSITSTRNESKTVKFFKWWAEQGSNLRPRPCKGRALPAELSARVGPSVPWTGSSRVEVDQQSGVIAEGVPPPSA
jgi:hypothetical protein